MAEGKKRGTVGKWLWGGARPAFLIAGGVALVAFGAIFGATLDIVTRPAPPPKKTTAASAPPPQRQPARVEIPRDPNAPPSFLAPAPAKPAPEIAPVTTSAPPASVPLIAHAVTASVPRERPVVAIVIDDMGLDRVRSQSMMELQGPLTLSLMTYAPALPALADQARKRGHEVMAHVPMEPQSAGEDPGPGALRVDMDEAAIRRTIAADLDNWSGYVGINNHMGSKFTADKARMAVVMGELKARGLLWLDSRTTGDSAGAAAALAAGVPFVERDVFLDNVETPEAVAAQLDQTLALAKSKGSAIAIGHPHDVTIAALKRWLPALDREGVALVPITEILRRRTQTGPASLLNNSPSARTP